MISISGTVLREESDERIENASIRATAASGTVVQTLSDDDGDFSFSDLEAGEWKVRALDEKSLPGKTESVLVTDSETKTLTFRLARLAGVPNDAAGRKFFTILIYGFLGLIVVYVLLHIVFPPAGLSESTGGDLNFLWAKDPMRCFEIIFWGLAGVLANKIINIGWYLRSHRFYQEGMVMHIAHLVTTPVLVFVAVLFLSLASFEITITGGSALVLSLANLPLLVSVSFLLGVAPWPLWNFIERTSKTITGPTSS